MKNCRFSDRLLHNLFLLNLVNSNKAKEIFHKIADKMKRPRQYAAAYRIKIRSL